MTLNEFIGSATAILTLLLALAASPKEHRATLGRWLRVLLLAAATLSSVFQVVGFVIADGAPTRVDIAYFTLSAICLIVGMITLAWEYSNRNRHK